MDSAHTSVAQQREMTTCPGLLVYAATLPWPRSPRARRRLLGMQKGGRKETPTKLYLTHWTFVNIMTINTFIAHFVGRDMLSQR
jgi:hypothetical protein